MKKIFLILVCCIFLLTTAYAESTITINPISEKGKISDTAVVISKLPQNIPSSVSIKISPVAQICTGKSGQIIDCPVAQSVSQPKTITAQLYPGAEFFVSADLQNIMQISENPEYPQIEVYYGYLPDNPSIPWTDYIRVENGFIVHGNYLSRQVTVIPTNQTKVQEIINSGEIPDWSYLQ